MNLFDLHYLVSAAAYPLVNCVVLVIYLTGAFRSRWQLGFSLLSTAIVFLLIPQFTQLFLTIQKHFGIVLISKPTATLLWPVSAIAEYISLGLYVCGAVVLVRAALKQSQPNVA